MRLHKEDPLRCLLLSLRDTFQAHALYQLTIPSNESKHFLSLGNLTRRLAFKAEGNAVSLTLLFFAYPSEKIFREERKLMLLDTLDRFMGFE